MSKLAKKPLIIPDNVNVKVENNKVFVEGKLGKLTQQFRNDLIDITIENKNIWVKRKDDSHDAKALQGLYWSLIRNMLLGVVNGYSKSLVIQGLGYKWELKGKVLQVSAGYIKPVLFPIPEGITITMENPQTLKIFGPDKHLVGEVASQIRSIRKPEPYKGKGIRYIDEVIKLKEGKSAK